MKPMTRTSIITAITLLLGLTGCQDNNTENGVSSLSAGSELTSASGSSDSEGHGSWSYHGETGPEHWAELSPEYAIAGTGREQSPVNIERAATERSTLPPIYYHYDEANVHFINNGHTVQANIEDGGNFISIGADRYELLQFHFHHQSENTVDGKHTPVEMHLVHKNSNGELAVVGVFFEEGDENETLEELWENLPHVGDNGYYSEEEVEIEELIPENRTAFRFAGSLTTPPCTEGVKWTVMADPLEMSNEQIDDFMELFSGYEFPEGNRRPVQPLYERTVYLDVDCDHDDD